MRWVLVRDPSGEHEPAAFLSTDIDARPATILCWFVSRWRVETTFQEVRAHLGVETQRQWSDLAILRTTPALLGLFSLITMWANGLARDTATALRPNTAAWYRKQEMTFSDAIAAVRRVLWAPPNFSMSRQPGETVTIAVGLLYRVFQTLCLAARIAESQAQAIPLIASIAAADPHALVLWSCSGGRRDHCHASAGADPCCSGLHHR